MSHLTTSGLVLSSPSLFQLFRVPWIFLENSVSLPGITADASKVRWSLLPDAKLSPPFKRWGQRVDCSESLLPLKKTPGPGQCFQGEDNSPDPASRFRCKQSAGDLSPAPALLDKWIESVSTSMPTHSSIFRLPFGTSSPFKVWLTHSLKDADDRRKTIDHLVQNLFYSEETRIQNVWVTWWKLLSESPKLCGLGLTSSLMRESLLSVWGDTECPLLPSPRHASLFPSQGKGLVEVTLLPAQPLLHR